MNQNLKEKMMGNNIQRLKPMSQTVTIKQEKAKVLSTYKIQIITLYYTYANENQLNETFCLSVQGLYENIFKQESAQIWFYVFSN